MSIPNSQFVHPLNVSSLVTLSLFSKPVSLFLFHKQVHLYHYLKISYLSNIIYLSFSVQLTSFSVISKSIHIVTNDIISFFNFILFLNLTILYWFCQISKWICHRYTLFHSFWRLSNTLFYICTTSLFIHMWYTFRLLPCLDCCKQHCSEYWEHVSFGTMIFSEYMPRSGISGWCNSSVFSFFKEPSHCSP